jgi:hypothetical protein
MPTRLARLGVLVAAAAFIGYWARRMRISGPPPGLILSFTPHRRGGGRPAWRAARAGSNPAICFQPAADQRPYLPDGHRGKIRDWPVTELIDRYGRACVVYARANREVAWRTART